MRFFTDEYYSETQKSKLLENAHLVEHVSVRLEDLKLPCVEPVFYTEWQQDHVEPEEEALDDVIDDPVPVNDVSSAMLMMLVSCFGILLVFDVLLG